LSKQKNDIKKYAPSLAGKALQYNEVLLKILALKGANTSPGLANEILKLIINGSFKTKIKKNDLTTPANRYYAKKKLNSVIDNRLESLQGDSEEPKFVEAIKKTKGEKNYSEWRLTFRGYILSLVVFDEVRRDWKGFFQRWRNVTPDHFQETHDLMIKYEVTDNVYNILFTCVLRNALKDGKLDVVDSDEIIMLANEKTMFAVDDLMDLVEPKKRPARNLLVKKIPIIGKLVNLKKEDMNSLLRLLNDPKLKNGVAKQTKQFIAIEKDKITVLEDILKRVDGT